MAKKHDHTEEELDRISKEFHEFIKDAFHKPLHPVKYKAWHIIAFWSIMGILTILGCKACMKALDWVSYKYPLGF